MGVLKVGLGCTLWLADHGASVEHSMKRLCGLGALTVGLGCTPWPTPWPAPLASRGCGIPAHACSVMGGLRGAPCGRLACVGPDGNPPEANAQVDVELGSMVLGLHVESPFVFYQWHWKRQHFTNGPLVKNAPSFPHPLNSHVFSRERTPSFPQFFPSIPTRGPKRFHRNLPHSLGHS